MNKLLGQNPGQNMPFSHVFTIFWSKADEKWAFLGLFPYAGWHKNTGPALKQTKKTNIFKYKELFKKLVKILTLKKYLLNFFVLFLLFHL